MTDDESRYQHFIIEKPENYEIWRLSKPDTASPTEPSATRTSSGTPWLRAVTLAMVLKSTSMMSLLEGS